MRAPSPPTQAMIADSTRPELRALARDILTSQRVQLEGGYHRLGLTGGDVWLACLGSSSASSAWSRSSVWTRRRVSASRRSVSIRSASSSLSTCSTRKVLVRTATIVIECASRASVLRLWPVSKSRTRAASFAKTSTTCSPASSNRCANGRPTPLAPSTAQTPLRPCLGVGPHRGVGSPVGGEPTRAEQLLVLVDDLDRRGQLVGVDPDDVLHVLLPPVLVPMWPARWVLLLRAGQSLLEPPSSRRPTGCRPIGSHTLSSSGQPQRSSRRTPRTESRQTPVLTESSSSREGGRRSTDLSPTGWPPRRWRHVRRHREAAVTSTGTVTVGSRRGGVGAR